MGARYWRRNRVDQVLYPTAKVLLFERFDGTRKGLGGVPVQFNAPEGHTLVCAVDGSVTEVNMGALSALAESADPNVNGTYRPSDYFDLSMSDFQYYDDAIVAAIAPLSQDPWQAGAGYLNGGPYRQFFWATRNGIRGRDLNR